MYYVIHNTRLIYRIRILKEENEYLEKFVIFENYTEINTENLK